MQTKCCDMSDQSCSKKPSKMLLLFGCVDLTSFLFGQLNSVPFFCFLLLQLLEVSCSFSFISIVHAFSQQEFRISMQIKLLA